MLISCHKIPLSWMQAASASVPEPTVTANTREAWAAINGMFSSALPHESAAVNVDVGGGPVAAAPRPPLPRRASLGAGEHAAAGFSPSSIAHLPLVC